MSRPETQAYIDHRLTIAGCTDGQLMDPAVSSAIHDRSGGVPRLINRLADATLLSAFANGRRRVTIDDLPVESLPEQFGVAAPNEEPPPIGASRPSACAPRPGQARSSKRSRTPAAARHALEQQLLSTAEWLSHRLHEAVEHLRQRAAAQRRPIATGSVSPTLDSAAAGPKPARSRSGLRSAMADFGDSLVSIRHLSTRRKTRAKWGVKK